jgi:hypothetical protein
MIATEVGPHAGFSHRQGAQQIRDPRTSYIPEVIVSGEGGSQQLIAGAVAR